MQSAQTKIVDLIDANKQHFERLLPEIVLGFAGDFLRAGVSEMLVLRAFEQAALSLRIHMHGAASAPAQLRQIADAMERSQSTTATAARH